MQVSRVVSVQPCKPVLFLPLRVSAFLLVGIFWGRQVHIRQLVHFSRKPRRRFECIPKGRCLEVEEVEESLDSVGADQELLSLVAHTLELVDNLQELRLVCAKIL